jgi:acyl dehydratase
VTGDHNPIHVDEEFAKTTRFGRRIAHGMLTASLISSVLANKLPGEGSVYLAQTLQFVAPVFAGDEVTARVTVKEIRQDKPILKLDTICINQRDEIVIRGEATVLATHKHR